MVLRGNLPKMTFITGLGAIDDSTTGLFSFDLILYPIRQANELLKSIHFLVGFCGACLLIINVNYLLLKAKAKIIVFKLTK